MLKVLTSISRYNSASSAFSHHARPYRESNSPLDRVLISIRSSRQKGTYFCTRFFCSDNTNGPDPPAEAGAEAKQGEVEVEGAAEATNSAAMVPTVFGPEDCLLHIGDFNYARLEDFGAATSGANKLHCQQVLEEIDELGLETDDKTALSVQLIFPNPETNGTLEKRLPTDHILKSTVSDLITKQHWSKLRNLINHADPTGFILHLFQPGFSSDAIFSFFKWSQTAYKVSYPPQLLCKLLVLAAKEKRYSMVRSLLHSFVKGGKIHSVSSFFHELLTCSDEFHLNSIIVDMLILALVNNSKADFALETFKRAGDYGFTMSVHSCNPFLLMLVKKKTGEIEFLYKDMLRRRIALNLFTFNEVVNGLCKEGKLNKAKDVMEDMKIRGVMPNVVTYNTLIDGYCKNGGSSKMYKADEVLKEMVGKGIQPSQITYNTLIDGFCKDNNIKAALKIFSEMKEHQTKPNIVTYNSLINGLCGDGRIRDALDLQTEMVSLGLQPNIVTHNALINGFSKNKMLVEARELFDQIMKKGVVVPSVLTFNSMMDGYCKAGKMEEAMPLFDLMLTKRIQPNVSTYNCLIGGYYRVGNLEKAKTMLDEMAHKGLKADIVTYNIQIDAMCKMGESRKAARLLDEIYEDGLIPNHITYNKVMAGYCQEGNPKAAVSIRRRMEREGKKPNVASFNVLMKGFCSKGKLEEANSLLNEMLEKGLAPNRTTYDIINGEMIEKGFVPDIDVRLYNDGGD
ncbi:unnamed protein product [Cuscuta epithymum]|uniref:Pentatricopeptide repeat-containing protein n=1 Tax=Cuscuta epithymum TaxID=186058 RepID=A0AAV0GB24_9ASTE|nr:unnamed protein product [Cuscuta epithymum]